MKIMGDAAQTGGMAEAGPMTAWSDYRVAGEPGRREGGPHCFNAPGKATAPR